MPAPMTRREREIAQARYRIRTERYCAAWFRGRVAAVIGVLGASGMAGLTGLSRQTIHNLADGATVPSERTLAALCEAFPRPDPRNRPAWWIGS